ncbi:MAG: molybdenum cofactor guanylyltransferase [Actinomycetota bacterium]|nr:MAG: molybdenum cofactor guanylyltransferase [Actinomycetota bacterium]
MSASSSTTITVLGMGTLNPVPARLGPARRPGDARCRRHRAETGTGSRRHRVETGGGPIRRTSVEPVTGVDVIVLAGGASRRMGTDKLALRRGDRSLLDYTVAGLIEAVPVASVAVAGPPRPLPASLEAAVTWAPEDPPAGGPVAGLAAAAAVGSASVVLVAAGDTPYAAAAAPALLAALRAGRPAGVAVAVLDIGGRVQPLSAAWHRPALLAALAAIGDPVGARARDLLAGATVVTVADRWRAAEDLDTPADADRAGFVRRG